MRTWLQSCSTQLKIKQLKLDQPKFKNLAKELLNAAKNKIVKLDNTYPVILKPQTYNQFYIHIFVSKRIPCYQTIKVPILLFLLIYTGIIYRLYTQISLSNTSPIIPSPFPRTDGVLLNYFGCHGKQVISYKKGGPIFPNTRVARTFPLWVLN